MSEAMLLYSTAIIFPRCLHLTCFYLDFLSCCSPLFESLPALNLATRVNLVTGNQLPELRTYLLTAKGFLRRALPSRVSTYDSFLAPSQCLQCNQEFEVWTWDFSSAVVVIARISYT